MDQPWEPVLRDLEMAQGVGVGVGGKTTGRVL